MASSAFVGMGSASTPIVVVTSVYTQTVRPTLVVTESTIMAPGPVNTVAATAQPDTQTAETIQPDSHRPRTTLETAHPDTVLQQTTHEDTSPTTPISTTLSSSAAGEHNISLNTDYLTVPSGHSNTYTNAPPAAASLSRSPYLLMLSTNKTFSIEITEASATIVKLTSTSVSPSQSSTSSPVTSSLANAISGPQSTGDSSGQTKETKDGSIKVRAIVGGTIGGATLLSLGLLACILFIRRKRRMALHERRISMQSFPHTPSMILPHNHQDPQSPVMVQSPTIPSSPVLPLSRCSDLPDIRRDPTSTPSNRNLSLDTMNLHNDNHRSARDPFADSGFNLTPPAIDISQPSHTASLYSRASWESGSYLLERREYHRSCPCSTYSPEKGTLALLGNGKDSTSPTPKRNRASTRSDPFDLEIPPNVLQKWAAL